MSGIYIPGLAMPERGHTVTLTITGGGKAVVQYYDCKPQLTVPIMYKAVPVPERGRLIDADALMERFSYSPGDTAEDRIWIRAARRIIIEAPTIIPADKEGEG